MKTLLLIILAMITATDAAYASNVQRIFRDVKLPTQAVMEHQTFTNVSAAGTTDMLSIQDAVSAGASVTLSSFIAQPDTARNLVVTPVSTTANLQSCTIAVSGTDYFGRSISENLHFNAASALAATTAAAFKTVATVAFPGGCEASPYQVRWNMGFGELIGLKRCMDANKLVFTTVAGAYETTRATVGYNSSTVSLNTLDFNGTMNGSNAFEAYFIQDYNASCQP